MVALLYLNRENEDVFGHWLIARSRGRDRDLTGCMRERIPGEGLFTYVVASNG